MTGRWAFAMRSPHKPCASLGAWVAMRRDERWAPPTAGSSHGRWAWEEMADWFNRGDLSAWSRCANPEWMLWILVRLDLTREQITVAACECAKHGTTSDAGHAAIAVALAWARGDVSLDEVRCAAMAACRDLAAYAAAESAAVTAYAQSAGAWPRDRRVDGAACEALRRVVPATLVASVLPTSTRRYHGAGHCY